MKAPLSAKSTEPLQNARHELPFLPVLNRELPERLGLQLFRHLRTAIENGQLAPGAPLPASRALARSLNVARGVVVETYAELSAQGYLKVRHGSVTRVRLEVLQKQVLSGSGGRVPAWLQTQPPAPAEMPPAGAGVIDFRLGQPTLGLLDTRAWRQVWGRVARALPPSDYRDPAGEPALRAALCSFLATSRGLRLNTDALFVTNGAAQGLGLIASALLRPGAGNKPARVVVENPGYPAARAVFHEAGAVLIGAEVDQDGLIVERLPPARLVYVTPSHQYPLGVRLSASRRLALLDWAEQHDALIVEDDYDSEYRYGADPLPTLASLDGGRGRILYLGTLSKTLTPALRLGYLAVPPSLVPALQRQKTLSDGGTSWPLQLAMTEFIRAGHLERHIRRSRKHYASLSSTLADRLAHLAPHARLGGLDAGLHACLHLAEWMDAEQIAAACLERGVQLTTMKPYALGTPLPALLLGFGGLTQADLTQGCDILAGVILDATQASVVRKVSGGLDSE